MFQFAGLEQVCSPANSFMWVNSKHRIKLRVILARKRVKFSITKLRMQLQREKHKTTRAKTWDLPDISPHAFPATEVSS